MMTMVGAEQGVSVFNETCKIPESFDLTFSASTAEDLSDVDKSTNMHTFRSKNYGLELELPGDIIDTSDVNVENKFEFVNWNDDGIADPGIQISVYSSFEGHTYQSWAETDYKNRIKQLNPKHATFTPPIQSKIAEKDAMTFTEEVNVGDKTYRATSMFIDAGDYFYRIFIQSTDTPKGNALVNNVKSSLKLTPINAAEIGRLVCNNEGEIRYKEFKPGINNVTYQAPSTWKEGTTDEIYYVGDIENLNSFGFFTIPKQGLDGVSSNDVAKSLYENIEKQKNMTITSTVKSSDLFSRSAFMFSYQKKEEDSTVNYYYYVVHEKSNFYVLIYFVDDVYDGAQAKEIRDTILTSFQCDG